MLCCFQLTSLHAGAVGFWVTRVVEKGGWVLQVSWGSHCQGRWWKRNVPLSCVWQVCREVLMLVEVTHTDVVQVMLTPRRARDMEVSAWRLWDIHTNDTLIVSNSPAAARSVHASREQHFLRKWKIRTTRLRLPLLTLTCCMTVDYDLSPTTCL